MAPKGKYLALATDTSRNIVMNIEKATIIRNLYGHKNDGFSQPKVAWSQNGQYLFGNNQEDSSVCVWDIASSAIIKKLEGQHGQPVRDMYSSSLTHTLVTTSFDKKTVIWLTSGE
jgi:WD40 repeat protein